MATMLRVLLAASILSLASCTPESGNWLFHYTGIMPPIKSIPAVVYVTKAVLGEVTSGCGASNQKCNCTVSQYDGDQGLYYGFNMAGQGTDGTATGLGFTCEFSMAVSKGVFITTGENTCQCDLTINIPFTADNSFVTSACPCLLNISSVPADGHDITITDNDVIGYVAPGATVAVRTSATQDPDHDAHHAE